MSHVCVTCDGPFRPVLTKMEPARLIAASKIVASRRKNRARFVLGLDFARRHLLLPNYHPGSHFGNHLILKLTGYDDSPPDGTTADSCATHLSGFADTLVCTSENE